MAPSSRNARASSPGSWSTGSRKTTTPSQDASVGGPTYDGFEPKSTSLKPMALQDEKKTSGPDEKQLAGCRLIGSGCAARSEMVSRMYASWNLEIDWRMRRARECKVLALGLAWSV
ncbi:hypothetical protein PRIC1_005173 [Phytophthora ramorum]